MCAKPLALPVSLSKAADRHEKASEEEKKEEKIQRHVHKPECRKHHSMPLALLMQGLLMSNLQDCSTVKL